MTIIGLDLGRRRIGVAVATTAGLGARPLVVIDRRSGDQVLDVLRPIVREWEAQRIVVGLPLNMDGSEGPGARHARRFAAGLAAHFEFPVDLQDERLTSFEARDRLKDSSLGRLARRNMEDAAAAALILERWLDANAPMPAAAESPGEASDVPTDPPLDFPAFGRKV